MTAAAWAAPVPFQSLAMTETIDCAIIGGGPAGLVAALYLLRFRRSVLIADKGSSRAALIPRSHNYPGFPDGVSGEDLLARLREQVSRYGAPTIGREVLALERGVSWRVVMPDRFVLARRVVLATGVVDRTPPILNAEDAIREGVLRYCPVCDGFEAREGRIAVIGDTDHAAREALFLRTYSASVDLLTERESLSEAMRARLASHGVDPVAIRPGSLRFIGDHICGDDKYGVALQPYEIGYGALGVDPQTQLLRRLGVVLDGGCIAVDAKQQTSLPGLYAAGDVVRGLDQISVAMGEAAIAATAIHNSLREEED